MSMADGSISVTWLCGSGMHCTNTTTPGTHPGDDLTEVALCVHMKHERKAVNDSNGTQADEPKA
jgi:hypothetical protein